MMFTKITEKISESIATVRKAIENAILRRIRFYSEDAKAAFDDCYDQVDFVIGIEFFNLTWIGSQIVDSEVAERIQAAKEIYAVARSRYARAIVNLQRVINLTSEKNKLFSKLVPNHLMLVVESVRITGNLGFAKFMPEIPPFSEVMTV